jgi:ABC-type transport system involved in multi-copper enzyme maturation permease subunit
MMDRVLAIASSVVADAIRKRIVWVVVLFGAAMAVAIPALPSYGVGVVEAVYREVALALTYVATLVVALTLSATRVPSEVEHRTVYNILSRNVRRWEYIVGTWLGIVATIAVVMVAFTAIDLAVGFFVYGELMWTLVEATFAILLEAAVLSAFAVAISSVTGPVVVAVASLAFLFVAHVRSLLELPDELLRFYPSLDAFNIITPVAHGSGVGAGYVGAMLLTFVGWSAVLLAVAVLLFGRRDL